jgi:hypothetical protein
MGGPPQQYGQQRDKNLETFVIDPTILNDHKEYQPKYAAHTLDRIKNESISNID